MFLLFFRLLLFRTCVMILLLFICTLLLWISISVPFIKLTSCFLFEGSFLLLGWIAVEIDLVLDKLNSRVDFCWIPGREQFDSLELIYDLNAMIKVLIFWFLFFLLLLYGFLDFLLFVRLLGNNNLSTTFYFFLPLLAKFELSRLPGSGVLEFSVICRL